MTATRATPPEPASSRADPVALVDPPAAVVDRWGSLRAIGLMRALMGAVVIRHLWPDLTAEVTAVERFHVPFWSWLPVPAPGLHRGLAVAGAAAGALMLVGLASRAATVAATAVVTYLVMLDMTAFAHNRGFLVWLLLGLSLLRTDRAWSLDARRRPPSDAGGPLWPVVLLRVVVSSVYLTSGLTKLADPDWRSGLVLWDRVTRHQHLIPFDGWVTDALTSRAVHHLLSPTAIAIEVFVGVGLWLHRTRLTAVWVALAFHASIEVVASVQTFSFSAIAALLLWVTPREADRTLTGAGRPLTVVVRHLDWLARFRVVERAPADPGASAVTQGAAAPGPMLVDRDGRAVQGREATLVTLSRLPLTFPFAGPALAVHRLRHRRGVDHRPGARTTTTAAGAQRAHHRGVAG